MSRHVHVCEVLVVGGGPAGLVAAYRAAQNGKNVTVVDDNPDVGGQIWRAEKQKSSSAEAAQWFEKIRQAKIHFINGARVYEQTFPGTLLAEK